MNGFSLSARPGAADFEELVAPLVDLELGDEETSEVGRVAAGFAPESDRKGDKERAVLALDLVDPVVQTPPVRAETKVMETQLAVNIEASLLR